MEKGIDLVNPNKPEEVIGKSKVASYRAVMETSISRYILAVPILLPSACLYFVEKRRLMPKGLFGQTLLQCLFIYCELYIAVPLAIAFYPQYGTIKAEDVEPHIRDWTGEDGQKLKEFMYNKGL